jgi:preprotein translocase subunit SecG
MGTLVISLLTLVLLLISAFVVLIILMQRTSQNGGMGAALGGGAAESAFGSETNNVLTKATIYGTILFFVIALVLYLIYQARAADLAETSVDASSLIISSDSESIGAEAVTDLAVEGTKASVEASEGVTTESAESDAVDTVSD